LVDPKVEEEVEKVFELPESIRNYKHREFEYKTPNAELEAVLASLEIVYGRVKREEIASLAHQESVKYNGYPVEFSEQDSLTLQHAPMSIARKLVIQRLADAWLVGVEKKVQDIRGQLIELSDGNPKLVLV